MSLVDVEWLSIGNVAAVLGWKFARAKTAVMKHQFGPPRKEVSVGGRESYRVHRDAVLKYIEQTNGGRHGRR